VTRRRVDYDAAAAEAVDRTNVRREVDNAERHLLAAIARGGICPSVFVTWAAIRAIWIGGNTYGVTPSRAHLAERTGQSERTVTRNVHALEAAQVLEVDRDDPVHTAGKGWRRRRCNRYCLVARPRKARWRPGDTGDTRSRSLPVPVSSPSPRSPRLTTDSTRLAALDAGDKGPPFPEWSPSPAERARVAVLIAEMRARRS